MELNHKMLRENADPNCRACKGSGYRLIAAKKRELGKGTLSIGDKSFPITDVNICDKIKVLCPLCFGPNGEPRSKGRVKK